MWTYKRHRYFAEKERQGSAYLKTLKGSGESVRELIKFYKDRSADQAAVYQLLEHDESETSANMQAYVEFPQKTLIPDLAKKGATFNAYFVQQQKLFVDCQNVRSPA